MRHEGPPPQPRCEPIHRRRLGACMQSAEAYIKIPAALGASRSGSHMRCCAVQRSAATSPAHEQLRLCDMLTTSTRCCKRSLQDLTREQRRRAIIAVAKAVTPPVPQAPRRMRVLRVAELHDRRPRHGGLAALIPPPSPAAAAVPLLPGVPLAPAAAAVTVARRWVVHHEHSAASHPWLRLALSQETTVQSRASWCDHTGCMAWCQGFGADARQEERSIAVPAAR